MDNIQEIFNKIESQTSLSVTNFIIQGGYFESNTGIDEFSINTFNAAINLGKLIKKASNRKNVFHSVLVNDLGQDCSAQSCAINKDNVENVDVRLLTTENLINRIECKNSPILISTEKTLKNRSLRKIRKIMKKKAAQAELYGFLYFLKQDEVSKWYLTSKYGSDILLFSMIGDNCIAKCPLIMGAYYSDMFSHGYFENQKFVDNIFIIDFCSFTDKDKVLKGAEVALNLFNEGKNSQVNKTIIPIFCDTDCKKMIPLEISYT